MVIVFVYFCLRFYTLICRKLEVNNKYMYVVYLNWLINQYVSCESYVSFCRIGKASYNVCRKVSSDLFIIFNGCSELLFSCHWLLLVVNQCFIVMQDWLAERKVVGFDGILYTASGLEKSIHKHIMS